MAWLGCSATDKMEREEEDSEVSVVGYEEKGKLFLLCFSRLFFFFLPLILMFIGQDVAQSNYKPYLIK